MPYLRPKGYGNDDKPKLKGRWLPKKPAYFMSKLKEVDKNKCSVCGKPFGDNAPPLPQEQGRCVFSQCADCFLADKTTKKIIKIDSPK